MDLLDKMTTFVRVIEAGNFSAAAHQLRISSAAVSRQIALLEASVKTPLLLRSTRRMTVTPAGRRYYDRCVRILRDVEDAQASVRGGDVAGPLRVTASVTFGLAYFVPILHGLVAKHPELRLDLRLEDRIVDLALDDVDVAIRVGKDPPESTELVAHRVFEFHRILVASPAYLRRRGTPKRAADLADHDTLAFAADDVWLGVPIAARFRSNALHALRTLALAGDGIAMLPEFLVADELAARSLRRVLAWRSEPIGVIAMYRTTSRGEARVRALVEYLRATLAK